MSANEEWGKPGLQYPTDLNKDSVPVQKAFKMALDNLFFLHKQVEGLASKQSEATPSKSAAGAAGSDRTSIVARAQTAVIGSTNFANGGSGSTFRVSYYLETTVPDGAAGTIQLSIAFTDDGGATSLVSTAVNLSATDRTNGVFFVQRASGQIAYSTINFGGFGSAQYALYICFERLS